MHTLAKPPIDALATYNLCFGAISNKIKRANYAAAAGAVQAAAAELDAVGPAGAFHTIAPAESVAGLVGKTDMAYLYDVHMARQKSVGRQLYDWLLAQPQHGICPLCAQRVVSTLDHYLPKAHYPALAVAPANLVPSCFDCNRVKLDHVQTSAETTFHPYFHRLPVGTWLHATVRLVSGTALTFAALPPTGWPDDAKACVEAHFAKLRLRRLYGAHAAQELANIRHSLRLVHGRGGPDAVRAHLGEQAVSRQVSNPNSWQSAMYVALQSNDWFCTEGFAF